MDFEVLDISEMNYDARRAYYQNISKKALEIEFEKVMKQMLNDKTK
jgi:hypothetical protein